MGFFLFVLQLARANSPPRRDRLQVFFTSAHLVFHLGYLENAIAVYRYFTARLDAADGADFHKWQRMYIRAHSHQVGWGFWWSYLLCLIEKR